MLIRKASRDPRDQYPKPPFPDQRQKPPGREAEMNPRPDYGLESYLGSGRLKGKVALITGGDSGIGRAVALAYAREGADVAISYLDEHEDAKETQEALLKAGVKSILLPGDVQKEGHCKELVERTVEDLGALDILVINAAYQKSFDSIEDVSEAELDRTMRTNVHAMFYLAKAAIGRMGPGSSIICTSSIQAYQPDASLLPYAVTKAAIANFVKGFAEEAIKKGIRVNAVAPGPIWTPLIPSTMDTADFGSSAPMGRAGQPVELAPVYVLLASPESDYVTGQVWGVTGGKPLT